MIRAGALLFAVGAVCTLVAMLPLVAPVAPASVLWFLAMLMGAGFLLLLLGLVGNARRRSRFVRRELAGPPQG